MIENDFLYLNDSQHFDGQLSATNIKWIGKMAHWVKDLLCKNEELRLQYTCKSWHGVHL